MIPSVAGLRVCEFGDQIFWIHTLKRFGLTHEVARDWYLDCGAKEYVSIDMNGEHGAIKMDLSKAFWPKAVADTVMYERFDVVTNIGTSEHVDPGPGQDALEAQYNCFKNAYDLCKVGGLMIHQLPPVGQWLDHCRIRYHDRLPMALARDFRCELINNERVNLATLGGHVDYLAFALRKGDSGLPPRSDWLDAVEVTE